MTNISSTDIFIFQRKNGAVSTYLKTAAGQMSEFFRDVYNAELDTIIADVERIEKAFEDGDTVINDRIDAYADRVKIAADNVLPIVSEDFWAYKFDLETLSSFRYNYNSCINGNDSIPPILDDPSEEACLDKHALKAYENLLDESIQKDSCFYVITPSTDQRIDRVSHLFISNKPLDKQTGESTTDLNGPVDWEIEVTEGDMIQLSLVKQTATGAILVDDEHYGMFKVVTVTNIPTDTGEEPFSMVTVEHIGGPHVAFSPLYRYQVKVMKSLGTTLSSDFVQKSGDIMSGALTIDAATADNPRTFFNKGESQTHDLTVGALDHDGVIRTIGAGATKLSIESASLFVTTTDEENSQLRITDSGITSFLPVSYDSVISITETTNLPHKAYVDNADSILDIRIDQTNDRIDTISDVLEKQEYEMTFVEDCWNETNVSDYDQWIFCTKQQISNDANLLANTTLYPKPTYAHKDDATGAITPLEVDKVNGLLVAAQSIGGVAVYSVNHEDIIELQLSTPGEQPQIIRYLAQKLDDDDDEGIGDSASKKVTTLLGEDMYFINLNSSVANYLGSNEVQEGMNYVLKHFPKNQGISVDDADNRYLRQEGDNILDGTLKVRGPVDLANPLSAISIINNDGGDVGLHIRSSGDLEHIGSGVTYVSPTNVSSNASVEIDYESLNFTGQTGVIKFGGSEKITIRGTKTSFHNNELNGVLTVPSSATDDAVATLGWIRNNLISFFEAGPGISVFQPDNTNNVKITAVNQRLIDIEDVVIPNNLAGGETLTYDGTVNKWVVSDLAQLIRGHSTLAQSEEMASVGGIWSDGTNFFIKVE